MTATGNSPQLSRRHVRIRPRCGQYTRSAARARRRHCTAEYTGPSVRGPRILALWRRFATAPGITRRPLMSIVVRRCAPGETGPCWTTPAGARRRPEPPGTRRPSSAGLGSAKREPRPPWPTPDGSVRLALAHRGFASRGVSDPNHAVPAIFERSHHEVGKERPRAFPSKVPREYQARTAARAIERAYQPCQLNYATFGNAVPHVHTYIIPRYLHDPAPGRPLPDGFRQRTGFEARSRSANCAVTSKMTATPTKWTHAEEAE
jgi:hypothetical protein